MKRLLVILFVALLGTGLFAQENLLFACKTSKPNPNGFATTLAKEAYCGTRLYGKQIKSVKPLKNVDLTKYIELAENGTDDNYNSMLYFFDDETMLIRTVKSKKVKMVTPASEWDDELETYVETGEMETWYTNKYEVSGYKLFKLDFYK